MGPQGDVRLTRSGEGKLDINSDVMMGSLYAEEGKLTIGNVELRSYIQKILAMELARVGRFRCIDAMYD